jgi:hypothetical protein
MIKEAESAMTEQTPIYDSSSSSSELIAILFVSLGANQHILFKYPSSCQNQSKYSNQSIATTN